MRWPWLGAVLLYSGAAAAQNFGNVQPHTVIGNPGAVAAPAHPFDWSLLVAGGGGVTGPATACLNEMTTFADNTGKAIKPLGNCIQLLAGPWHSGPAPWENTLYEATPGVIASYLHGGWPSGPTSAFFGISNDYTAANDPPGASNDGPQFNTFIVSNSNNTHSATVSLGIANIVNPPYTNHGEAYGENIIVTSSGVVDGSGAPPWVGLEIDNIPTPGSTNLKNIGIVVNAMNVDFADPSPAINIGSGGNPAGRWTHGIMVHDGADSANVALDIGTAFFTGVSISQDIRLHARRVGDAAPLQAAIQLETLGNLQLLPDAANGQGLVIVNPNLAVTGVGGPSPPPIGGAVPFQVHTGVGVGGENFWVHEAPNAPGGVAIAAFNDAGTALLPMEIDASAVVVFAMPTGCGGLPSGALWNNGGAVNICP